MKYDDSDDNQGCVETGSPDGLCPCCGDLTEAQELGRYEELTSYMDCCPSCGWCGDTYYDG